VQKQLKNPSNTEIHDRNRPIRYAKLLLQDDLTTKDVRIELETTLQALQKSPCSVIEDYLIELLKHVKEQLAENEGYRAGISVELALGVPATWTLKVYRDMQMALETAIKRSQFGSSENIFIISEPEAAAACILEGSPKRVKVEEGETIVVCDADGGSVVSPRHSKPLACLSADNNRMW